MGSVSLANWVMNSVYFLSGEWIILGYGFSQKWGGRVP
jgi:hypothetical protein